MEPTRIRREQIVDSIKDILVLIKEYEDKARLTNDPKERLNCEKQIRGLRKEWEDYEAQLKPLEDMPVQARLDEPPKGISTLSPEHISLGLLPSTGPQLFGRKQRLQELDEAWRDPHINVITLVAWGGVGKSTLVNHWLMRLAHDGYPGAERVFGWSFYTQGVTDRVVSSDLFMEHALHWFGDPDPSRGSSWEKAERVARLSKRRRTLLILDGLEPLQYPPGPRQGRLRDVALTALFREFAAYNPGLCIVSTRLPVADLEQFESTTCPQIDLKNLSPAAGAQFLNSQQVRGSQEELEQASRDFGGHALALSLLAGFIRIVYNGDIQRRDKVRLLEQDEQEGGHAQRVMASYERWFGESREASLLRILGLFDRPVNDEVLLALRSGPIIPGLTDDIRDLAPSQWRRTIDRLRFARLLPERVSAPMERLEVHPLVREYFGKRLMQSNPDAWREGNSRLYEYYKTAAVPFPRTVREMDHLFLAMVHGCKAGRYKEVLHQVYIPRIMRGNEAYAANKLGAVGAVVAVLSYLFERGDWGRPAEALNLEDQLFVLTEAGRYLTEVRGYGASEVGRCYGRAEELCKTSPRDRRLFEVTLGLCRFHRVRGELANSGRLASDLSSLAQEIGDTSLVPMAERALATNHYYTGDFSKAEEHARKGAVSYDDPVQALVNAQLDVNEPRISCLGYQALALWFLGWPDRAADKARETVDEALALSHAHTLAIVLLIDAMIHQFRRNANEAKLSAIRLVELCAERGFGLWRISGEIIHAWGVTMLGEADEGTCRKIEQSIDAWGIREAKLFNPYWYGLLTECYLVGNRTADGLNSAAHGLRFSEQNGEHWWDAELHRLRGVLLWFQGADHALSEESLHKALTTARTQMARSLELRCAISLVPVWTQQDRTAEARSLLADSYASFKEGFETEDLMQARQLLSELES